MILMMNNVNREYNTFMVKWIRSTQVSMYQHVCHFELLWSMDMNFLSVNWRGKFYLPNLEVMRKNVYPTFLCLKISFTQPISLRCQPLYKKWTVPKWRILKAPSFLLLHLLHLQHCWSSTWRIFLCPSLLIDVDILLKKQQDNCLSSL